VSFCVIFDCICPSTCTLCTSNITPVEQVVFCPLFITQTVTKMMIVGLYTGSADVRHEVLWLHEFVQYGHSPGKPGKDSKFDTGQGSQEN